MKKIVQYSDVELVRLLTEDLKAKGHKFNTREFGVEFVTNADGETSALISGVMEKDEDENVQEPETDEGDPTKRAGATLREEVYDIVAVTLSKEGQTVDELVELVTEELSEQGKMPLASQADAAHSIRIATLKSLQHLEKQGRSEYVDDGELELWRKKKKKNSKKKPEPKVVPLNTAADILGGAGGVMDRGDALSEGASEGQPRQGTPRRKKSSRRCNGAGRGGGNRGGVPFTF